VKPILVKKYFKFNQLKTTSSDLPNGLSSLKNNLDNLPTQISNIVSTSNQITKRISDTTSSFSEISDLISDIDTNSFDSIVSQLSFLQDNEFFPHLYLH